MEDSQFVQEVEAPDYSDSSDVASESTPFTLDGFLSSVSGLINSIPKGLSSISTEIETLVSSFGGSDSTSFFSQAISDFGSTAKSIGEFFINNGKEVVDGQTVDTGKRGLINSIADYSEKNPNTAKIVGNIAIAGANAYQKQKDRDFQQQIFNQKIDAERAMVKDTINSQEEARKKRQQEAFAFTGKV